MSEVASPATPRTPTADYVGVDHAQVVLAWIFVFTRAVHAAIYILVNRVSLRFAAYVAGCLALGIMWTRFGIQVQ